MVEESHRLVLQKCRERKTPVFFAADSTDILFETVILDVRAEAMVIANTVTPEYITRVTGAKKFSIQCQMLQFDSPTIHSDGCNIIFPFGTLRTMEETRQTERVTFSPHENVTVEMLNPLDGETVLTKAVMEMSTAGFSIRTSPTSLLYSPGLSFKDMKVFMNGKLQQKVTGRVVYQRLFLNQKGKRFRQVGFQFEK